MNRKMRAIKPILGFSQSTQYLRLFLMKDGTQKTLSVLKVSHTFTELIKSVFSSSLSNSIMQTEQIVPVTKGM
jgi:hypothetical protein